MDKKDDTRKRISLEERQHYCQLIENGTGYHAIAEMYRRKHKLKLPETTFRLWRRDAKKILKKDVVHGKFNFSDGKRSKEMKIFEAEVKKEYLKRHKQLKLMLKNIVFCFFLPATTGWYQPCDSLILAQLKSKIRG